MNPFRFIQNAVIQWSLLLVAFFFLQVVINFCAFSLRQQAIARHSQEPVFYGAFLAATCIIVVLALVTFMKFYRAVRHLLKYLRAFEADVVCAC